MAFINIYLMLSQLDKNLLIERYARGREAKLIESYISEGPTAVKERLGLTDEEWTVIFDFLVFEHNLLYKAVVKSCEFFLNTYVKHGMAHVKDVLDVNDEKYDGIWEVVFDFLVISSEGLYYHVLEYRERYMMAFKARGGDFVRKVLGIWKNKYEENWAKILDLLLHGLCDDIFTEQNYDNGLKAFAYMMNGNREHRAVAKSEIAGKALL